MNAPPNHEPPFDEHAALAELEHLRAQIEMYKSQRRGIEDEFEQFVRSFKERGHEPAQSPVARLAAPIPALAPRVAAAPEQPPAPSEQLAPAPAPWVAEPTAPANAAPVHTATVHTAVETPEIQPAAPARWGGMLAGAAAVLLIAGAAAMWTLRDRAPDAAPADAPVVATPAPAPEPATTPQPAAAAPQSEVSTIRRVWLRVIADGERVVEREVPEGSRLPFAAEKTIIIRTGDAGAVRLSINGKDMGPLGREGEVVTRTFTVPAR